MYILPGPRESLDHAPALGFATLRRKVANGTTPAICFAQAFSLAHRPNMLPNMLNVLHTIRLDYLSCILTVVATALIGKKLWQGWVVAAVNSAVVCVIGVRTAQFGFVPANILCIALYASNLVHWLPKKQNQ